MLEKALKLFLFFSLVYLSIASVCLRYPLCYCNTNSRGDTKIFCKNVTDITPIQTLLRRYPQGVYSLRIFAPEMTDLPNRAFAGHSITVLEVDAPLTNIPDDALSGIFYLQIINFVGGNFGTISNAFSNGFLKTVQLVYGSLESIENQLQDNSKMTDALLYNNKISHISSDAFLNVQSLEYLNVSNNLLSILDPAFFTHIRQLRSIDLSNNELFTVDGYFDTLSPEVIKLYGNNLTSVDNAFHPKMWSTKVLDLGGNPYLNLSSRVFDGKIQSLTTLGLDDNNYDELDPYLLSNLRSLYKLSLNGNRLPSLPEYFFIHTPHLSSLELAGNEFSSIEDIFPVYNPHHFEIHTLKTLNLNSNKLAHIQFGSFANSIFHLDLGNNLIHYIQDYDFGNLTSVTNLNLSGNPLLEVDSGSFKVLTNLRTLDLSGTNLKQLNHSVQHLDKLKELYIDSSPIISIEFEEFLGLHNLQILSLKNNSLQSVYEVIQNLSSLTALDISNNNLATLTLDSLPTNGTKMASLKKLWMSGNPLSCDCRLSWILDWIKIKGYLLEDNPICQSPTNLRGRTIQSLNKNDLQFWQEDCPKSCDCRCEVAGENAYTIVDCTNKNLNSIPEKFPFNVKEVDLQNNNIITFSGVFGKNVLNLENLNIENNSLCNLNLNLSPSLKTLKLAGNNLTRFPVSQWNDSSKIQLMTLSKNPWICDCESWDFRQWLVKYQNYVSDIETVCCSPYGKLSNRVIIQLQKEEMCPTEKYTKIALISGIAVLVLILCLLCCICRKTLAGFFYSWGCGFRKVDDKHNYSFDAFLLYADEDEEFALNNIAEGLETRIPQIKLFIPTREVLLTSSSINIESSLADCRKVIILLTKEFIRNSQCIQLLKASMSCSIENSSRRMIFLLKGKGDILKEVDSTLKAIINNSVCLRWEEVFFWKKFRWNLPKKIESVPEDEESNLLIGTEIQN